MKYINQITFLFSLFITCLSQAMWTPLHQAVYNGNLEQVQQLLDAGRENVNTDDDFGFTPLHLAAGYGHEPIVKLLLAAGADVSVVNIYNSTPLDLAEKFNHTEIATLLKNWPKCQNLLEKQD